MNFAIEIVCAADERFAMPLAVTICSAADNCSGKIRVFVMSTNLSAKSKKSIESACARSINPPMIEWIDIDADYMRDQPVGLQHLSTATYLRLAMGRMLPPEVSRAIYLDSDVLVVRDLASLWNTPLDGKVIGAVRDFMTPVAGAANALQYCLAETNIAPSHPMFNAGILLIDLDAYRSQNIEADCIAFLKCWRHDIQSADQDALNVVLRDRSKPLDFRWNVQMGAWNAFKQNPCLTDQERKTLCELDPAILHFSGSGKPWNSGLRSSYARTYIRSVDKTGWYGFLGFYLWRAKRLVACVQTIVENKIASFNSRLSQPSGQLQRTS